MQDRSFGSSGPMSGKLAIQGLYWLSEKQTYKMYLGYQPGPGHSSLKYLYDLAL